MDEELKEEVNRNLFTRQANLDAYKALRKSINTSTHEFDEIRFEICNCLVMTYHQAAITLTNHLLEKFLRYRVIYDVSKFNQIHSLEDFNKLDEVSESNTKNSLQHLINAAKKKNIISKEQQSRLNEYNLTIRTPYSHGMANVFGKDEKVMLGLFSFTDDTKKDIGEVKASGMLPLHGMMQEGIASKQALPYFLYVDDLIMSKCECYPRWK